MKNTPWRILEKENTVPSCSFIKGGKAQASLLPCHKKKKKKKGLFLIWRDYTYAEFSQLICPGTSKRISWGLNAIGIEQVIDLHLHNICALLFNSDILNKLSWKVWLIERDIRNQAFKMVFCNGATPQMLSQNGTPKFSTKRNWVLDVSKIVCFHSLAKLLQGGRWK